MHNASDNIIPTDVVDARTLDGIQPKQSSTNQDTFRGNPSTRNKNTTLMLSANIRFAPLTNGTLSRTNLLGSADYRMNWASLSPEPLT